jgi:hypothetical protein
MMGNYTKPKMETYDGKKLHKSGQINFNDLLVKEYLTEQQGADAQSVLAGFAFELCTVPDHGVLAPHKLFAVISVREVLMACGVLQPLGSRLSQKEAS